MTGWILPERPVATRKILPPLVALTANVHEDKKVSGRWYMDDVLSKAAVGAGLNRDD